MSKSTYFELHGFKTTLFEAFPISKCSENIPKIKIGQELQNSASPFGERHVMNLPCRDWLYLPMCTVYHEPKQAEIRELENKIS